jgi:hypothetical protein
MYVMPLYFYIVLHVCRNVNARKTQTRHVIESVYSEPYHLKTKLRRS